MNQAQTSGILRILLAAGGPIGVFLIAHGFSDAQVNDLSNWIIAGIPIVLGIWSWWRNRRAALAKDAGQIPGVKVIVSPAAPESVQAVAKDTSDATKNVVMAPK